MSENNTYTTGELASTCGVTVRTVQYYDTKGLLAPSGYSEGGRRLYTEDDADRLRFIVMLKSLGLGLAQIRGVLDSANREAILRTLLDEQALRLEDEVAVRKEQLAAIALLRSDLQRFGVVTAVTESDVATGMEDRKAERRCRAAMLVVGAAMDAAWIGALVYGIVSGVWWPFPIALGAVAAAAAWAVVRIDAHVTYRCPACGCEFRPVIREFFFARHTKFTRRLTCPCCGVKDWGVERYHAARLAIRPGERLPGKGVGGLDESQGSAD